MGRGEPAHTRHGGGSNCNVVFVCHYALGLTVIEVGTSRTAMSVCRATAGPRGVAVNVGYCAGSASNTGTLGTFGPVDGRWSSVTSMLDDCAVPWCRVP
jgi:hypothetical protein